MDEEAIVSVCQLLRLCMGDLGQDQTRERGGIAGRGAGSGMLGQYCGFASYTSTGKEVSFLFCQIDETERTY